MDERNRSRSSRNPLTSPGSQMPCSPATLRRAGPIGDLAADGELDILGYTGTREISKVRYCEASANLTESFRVTNEVKIVKCLLVVVCMINLPTQWSRFLYDRVLSVAAMGVQAGISKHTTQNPIQDRL